MFLISPPCTSEGAAMAAIEAMLAETCQSAKGKAHVIKRGAYEESGLWYAEIVFDLEPAEDKAPEPDHHMNEQAGPKSDIAVLLVPSQWGISNISEEDLIPKVEAGGSDSLHAAPHMPDKLEQDFIDAETVHGEIPLLEMVMDAPVQERLAHDARLSAEYQALRRKIYLEELETLRPANDLRPEPGVAA